MKNYELCLMNLSYSHFIRKCVLNEGQNEFEDDRINKHIEEKIYQPENYFSFFF